MSNPADVLAATDIFVLPSLVEGLPLALLEAMRAGKPIVATAVGGVPEAVTSGVNGLLVAPADDVALADAIAILAASPQQRAELGEQARARADRDSPRSATLGRSPASTTNFSLDEPLAKTSRDNRSGLHLRWFGRGGWGRGLDACALG